MSVEEPLLFPCEGAQLVGVLHHGGEDVETGVVIVVGGPQYRVGSHRQFILLARFLAANGVSVMRFDYRGMGDSEGETRTFDKIDADIAAAVNAFFTRLPRLRRMVLWGLCDAASAALFHAPHDPRIVGMVLLNPWIRTEATQARTYLRHYYLSHVRDPEFWRRMFSGRLSISRAVRAFAANVSLALWPRDRAATRNGGSDEKEIPFPQRMLRGMQTFSGRVLLILSGNDLTAAEFRDATAGSRAWRKLLARRTVERRELPNANHTFSTEAWRAQVAAWTLEWVRSW